MSMTVPGNSGRDAVDVTVHDGRSFRDPDKVDPRTGLGDVLVTFTSAVPYRVGDSLGLPDGTTWTVSAVSDRMSLTGTWSQVVTVSDS
jgi:hypothetical protein